jgi:hypothetical protein
VVVKIVIFGPQSNLFSLKKKMLWRQTKFFLCENDKIVNNTKDVTECFNNFFSTVANSIGKDGKNQAVSADTSVFGEMRIEHVFFMSSRSKFTIHTWQWFISQFSGFYGFVFV